MNPSAVGVIASNYRQACIAAKKAGLTPGAAPPGNWFYVSAIERVRGWLPGRVIIARPMLSELLSEWAKQMELEAYVRYRCMRTKIEPEVVWT